MNETKEKIMRIALRRFACDGYEAVSVADITGELGITKGALYRHFASKREIFDSILERMEMNDAEYAKVCGLPELSLDADSDGYKKVSAENLCRFCVAQFDRWTHDGFCSDFRRMLSLERFRNDDMAALYSQYLTAGPIGYLEDIVRESGIFRKDANDPALSLFAPLYLSLDLYDISPDKDGVRNCYRAYIEKYVKENII